MAIKRVLYWTISALYKSIKINAVLVTYSETVLWKPAQSEIVGKVCTRVVEWC